MASESGSTSNPTFESSPEGFYDRAAFSLPPGVSCPSPPPSLGEQDHVEQHQVNQTQRCASPATQARQDEMARLILAEQQRYLDHANASEAGSAMDRHMSNYLRELEETIFAPQPATAPSPVNDDHPDATATRNIDNQGSRLRNVNFSGIYGRITQIEHNTEPSDPSYGQQVYTIASDSNNSQASTRSSLRRRSAINNLAWVAGFRDSLHENEDHELEEVRQYMNFDLAGLRRSFAASDIGSAGPRPRSTTSNGDPARPRSSSMSDNVDPAGPRPESMYSNGNASGQLPHLGNENGNDSGAPLGSTSTQYPWLQNNLRWPPSPSLPPSPPAAYSPQQVLSPTQLPFRVVNGGHDIQFPSAESAPPSPPSPPAAAYSSQQVRPSPQRPLRAVNGGTPIQYPIVQHAPPLPPYSPQQDRASPQRPRHMGNGGNHSPNRPVFQVNNHSPNRPAFQANHQGDDHSPHRRVFEVNNQSPPRYGDVGWDAGNQPLPHIDYNDPVGADFLEGMREIRRVGDRVQTLGASLGLHQDDPAIQEILTTLGHATAVLTTGFRRAAAAAVNQREGFNRTEGVLNRLRISLRRLEHQIEAQTTRMEAIEAHLVMRERQYEYLDRAYVADQRLFARDFARNGVLEAELAGWRQQAERLRREVAGLEAQFYGFD